MLKKTRPPDAQELRIAMLGYGFMGRCHTNAYRVIPFFYPEAHINPRLLILCGQQEDNLEREAARFGFEEFGNDWKEVVADPRVDLFDNCGPDPIHPEPCIAALKNGKHVLCEKPLALSLDAARQMRDAAASAKGKALCVFNYRFMPAVRFAKDLIDSGKLGTIYNFRVSYQQYYGHDSSLTPAHLWYCSGARSGILQGIGSHAIDQGRFLVGEIKSVSSLVRTFHPERALPTVGCEGVTADEATVSILEFQNGAVGVMEASGVAPGRKNFLSWEINASKGSLRWDLEHPNSLFACLSDVGDCTLRGFTEISVTDPSHPYAGKFWGPGHNLGWEQGHLLEKYHIIDALAHGKPLSPFNATFEDGYRNVAIIYAMRESSRTGKKVELVW